MVWIVLAVACVVAAIIFGIWLGRTYYRPLPQYDDLVEERKKEIDNEIKIYKYEETMKTERELTNLMNEYSRKENEAKTKFLLTESKLSQEIKNLENAFKINTEKVKESSNLLAEWNKKFLEQKKRILQNQKYAKEQELKELRLKYESEKENVDKAIEEIQKRLDDWSKAERAAYEERQSREEVRVRNRLSISEDTVEELQELYSACKKLKLSNPTPLYKAIYEIYLRGVVKELVVRLGVSGKCGIYKITNITNDKVYIGQSVDIGERWKQHIKRGTKCEAGTIAGAGLYDAMFNEGIWNFSFQILEVCEKEQLNSHEKMWISHYQSNEIGYNKRL